MNLTEYLISNGEDKVYEGFIFKDQCTVIDKHVDWSKIKSVLEIGFNAGHSSEFFLSRNPNITVVSFEITPERYRILGKKYIDEKYPGRHELVWGDSTVTIPKFPTKKFDLIFIDGGHELEVARADIANCMRFAHPNTIVTMDDVIYEHTWAAKYSVGPTRAWREFINISVIEETFHVDISDGRGMSIGRYKVFHDFSIKKPKVADAFMFYNELEMLKYRLTVMGPYVDRFVICECPVSFSGNPKPLYFEENKHMFEPWLHKITHLVWKGYKSPVNNLDDSWFNENTQRNYLLEGLKNLMPNDIVIISDIDEIIDPKVLEKADEVIGSKPVIALEMDMYYYTIEHKLRYTWSFARIARYSFVRDVTPHHIRNTNRTDPVVKDAGWHMSYFGSEQFIIRKTKNFAHIEASQLYKDDDIEKIRDVITRGADLYNRDAEQCLFVPKIHNTRLPPYADSLPYQT